ncbi:two component sigma-54 specific Fis family transcriptional regulator [Catenovulum agarivorans DS-2]|uniref:Two component sigma-54 specific Fis family transcriptional regulator n=1 Tax=Catenovulum agarivorans DS-2 TaxID=1328313 RepID=W7QD96_9ALTE|nr:sigma-54 dependent transcriptional regulator [Catenovulum agarivorans]EWH10874.1 two component sigma-54 specific Fis family transcriptional regulator [Catenovulum agarivorans DS-2]
MLKVLIVDDDSEFADISSQILEFIGHDTYIANSVADAKQWLSVETFDHIFLDFMLPDGSGLHVIEHANQLDKKPRITLITGHPLIKSIIADLSIPDIGYITKPVERADFEAVLSQNKSAKKTTVTKTKQQEFSQHFDCLIGESPAMQSLYKMIEQVAKTNANVMLMGESGVGKEVVAQAIHNASNLDKPLVATNCGALSKDLIGSELFGHEKGAFTGAVASKKGVFEQANDSTLFLDEVTEMPIDMQPNLLRVLENKTVVPLGSTKQVKVNCRVISATNRSIEDIASNNILREDIYFRLAVFPIEIPQLRQRKDDIPLLVNYFLMQMNQESQQNISINQQQLDKLQSYDWPGNVRELRHVIHRAFIMADTDSQEIVLPERLHSPFSTQKNTTLSHGLTAGQTIEDVEKELIKVTLEEVDGNKTLAAEMLGISTKTLYNRLNAYEN